MPENIKGLWYSRSLDKVLRFFNNNEIEIRQEGYFWCTVKFSDEFITYSSGKSGKVAYTLDGDSLYLELDGKSCYFERLGFSSYVSPEDGFDPGLIGKKISSYKFNADGKADYKSSLSGRWRTKNGILTTYLVDDKGQLEPWSVEQRWYVKLPNGEVIFGRGEK